MVGNLLLEYRLNGFGSASTYHNYPHPHPHHVITVVPSFKNGLEAGMIFHYQFNRLLSILRRYNRDSWIMAPLRIGYVPPFASFPLMMSIAN